MCPVHSILIRTCPSGDYLTWVLQVQDEPKQYRTEESMITVFLHYTVILHVPLLLVVKPIFTALSANLAFFLLSAVFLPVPVEEIGTLWSSWR